MSSFSSLVRRFTMREEEQNGKISKRRSFFSSLRRRKSQPFAPTKTKEIPTECESPALTKSPTPVVDSNKPLPRPPTANVEKEKEKIPPRPQIKLERIISPLKEADIRKIFSGAPQFLVHLDDDRVPLPSVEFPWDEAIETNHLADHGDIEHEAWKCSSMYYYYTRCAHQLFLPPSKASTSLNQNLLIVLYLSKSIIMIIEFGSEDQFELFHHSR